MLAKLKWRAVNGTRGRAAVTSDRFRPASGRGLEGRRGKPEDQSGAETDRGQPGIGRERSRAWHLAWPWCRKPGDKHGNANGENFFWGGRGADLPWGKYESPDIHSIDKVAFGQI